MTLYIAGYTVITHHFRCRLIKGKKKYMWRNKEIHSDSGLTIYTILTSYIEYKGTNCSEEEWGKYST